MSAWYTAAVGRSRALAITGAVSAQHEWAGQVDELGRCACRVVAGWRTGSPSRSCRLPGMGRGRNAEHRVACRRRDDAGPRAVVGPPPGDRAPDRARRCGDDRDPHTLTPCPAGQPRNDPLDTKASRAVCAGGPCSWSWFWASGCAYAGRPALPVHGVVVCALRVVHRGAGRGLPGRWNLCGTTWLPRRSTWNGAPS